jgi:prevent-host-death family protein
MARKKRTVNQVGAYDAKTRFGELLSEVEKRGVSITITRRGVPVARLVPARGVSPEAAQDILRDFTQFRAAHPLRGLTTKQLIEEGRKH